MFKGLGQLASLMRGATEVSGKLEDLAQSLRQKRVVGSAGGNMVLVEMNGLADATRVTIDPVLFTGGDREMLETLLCAAINQANAKAKEQHGLAMRELTGGIELPGLDQLMSQFSGEDPPGAQRRP